MTHDDDVLLRRSSLAISQDTWRDHLTSHLTARRRRGMIRDYESSFRCLGLARKRRESWLKGREYGWLQDGGTVLVLDQTRRRINGGTFKKIMRRNATTR